VAGGKEVAQLGVGNFEAFSSRLETPRRGGIRTSARQGRRHAAGDRGTGGHSHEIWSAAFSPDGTRIVTASEDRTSRVWDAATGRELGVLRGHRGIVRFAAFSRDGTRIVTTSDDKTARIWDAATAKEIGTLRGHRKSVRSAAFDPRSPARRHGIGGRDCAHLERRPAVQAAPGRHCTGLRTPVPLEPDDAR
jgi:WD40 repeat protein